MEPARPEIGRQLTGGDPLTECLATAAA